MSSNKTPRKVNLELVIPILLVISIIISSASVAISLLGKPDSLSKPIDNPSSVPTVSTPPKPVEKLPVTSFNSISLIPGEDFLIDEVSAADAIDRSKALLDNIKADGFDSVELTLNYKDGLLFSTQGYSAPVGDLLKEFYSYAKRQSLTVITAIDVRALTQKSIADENDIERICAVLSDKNIGEYSDMLLLKNCYILPEDIAEEEHTFGDDNDANEQYLNSRLNEIVKRFYFAAARADGTLYTGIEINEAAAPQSAVFDAKTWYSEGFSDFVVIFDPYSTELDEVNFTSYFENWKTQLDTQSDIYCKLDYSKIGSDEKGWEMTDQIIRQLTTLGTLEVEGFIIDGWHEYSNDTTESREAVKKYLKDLITDSYILRELTISKPEKKTFTTAENTVLLSGASDPEFKLTLNGEEIERTELGYFSTDLKLADGLNTFEIEHKGVTEVYKITYKRTIIKSLSPSKKQTLPSQSILLISCIAISNSKVTATLGDIEVTLTEEPIWDANGQPSGEYSNYTGRITLPTVYDQDLSYGKISFTAKSQYGTETEKGGNIVVLKEDRPAPPSSSESPSSSNPSNVTSSGNTSSGSTSTNAPSGGGAWVKPSSGKYVDVGTTYIAEVVNWQAETFSSTDDSDYSRPTNNYLPKGTLDYCSSGNVASSGGAMKIMRYGNMLYTTSSKGVSVLNVYKGTLPDHNTVGVGGVSNTGRHTQITLDVMWKAPFRLDIKPQTYRNESAGNRDYTITSATFDHIDITFCYTTLVSGEVVIPESDPVFKKAEWIKNESDYTLRLHLKKTGVFYGWSAEYNANGQLVFSFLNPAKVTVDTSNDYGYRLDGVVVAIDVGHGGNDVGAVGSHGKYNESQLNLILAEKLKLELEALGASVYMTRYDNNTNPSSEERMRLLRDVKADYCIAIHRNASDSSSPRAFNSYHFNAFSADAAKKIYAATEKADLYKVSKWSGTKWHYFYTCRQTDCPVVLTENGFITNADEYSQMIRDDFNNDCAKALTQGIVDYFVSVQPTPPQPYVPDSETTTDSSSDLASSN